MRADYKKYGIRLVMSTSLKQQPKNVALYLYIVNVAELLVLYESQWAKDFLVPFHDEFS